MPTEVQEETFTLEELLVGLRELHRLILWNDDINTFDHVIFCMMKYLDYSGPQAEKIAWKVHNARASAPYWKVHLPKWRYIARFYSKKG